MDNRINYKRTMSILGCLALSSTAFLTPSCMLTNSSIYADLLTVISIFCGVLIAVISILGTQPSKLSSQSKLLYELSTESKMSRLRTQFYLYLLVIAAALLCRLLNGDASSHYIIFYKATLFLGALAILTSFNLPKLLSESFKHTRGK